MKHALLFAGTLLLAGVAQAQQPAAAPQPATTAAPVSALPRTAAPAGAELYFIAPADGATVEKEFTVRFGLKGMGVAPAGITLDKTGHHHLLIDVAELPPMNQPLPNDATHKHFGGGQTEISDQLTPGNHSLQLVLADGGHIPHNPAVVSEKISVTVDP